MFYQKSNICIKYAHSARRINYYQTIFQPQHNHWLELLEEPEQRRKPRGQEQEEGRSQQWV